MKKLFKDTNNKAHEVDENFTHLLPVGCVEISQSEFDILTSPSPQEIEDIKTLRVESELGGDNIRVLTDVFKTIVNDGSIATKTTAEIIAQAKAKRRNELDA